MDILDDAVLKDIGDSAMNEVWVGSDPEASIIVKCRDLAAAAYRLAMCLREEEPTHVVPPDTPTPPWGEPVTVQPMHSSKGPLNENPIQVVSTPARETEDWHSTNLPPQLSEDVPK